MADKAKLVDLEGLKTFKDNYNGVIDQKTVIESMTLEEYNSKISEFENKLVYITNAPKEDEYPIATLESVGAVKPDGETITIDEDGTIHGSATVDIATSTTVGIVKPDNDTITIDEDGTLHGAPASTDVELTQAEYDALEKAGELEPDVNYFITDGQGGGGGIVDIDTATPTFEESESLENIESKETISTLFGKIKKVISTLFSFGVVAEDELTVEGSEYRDADRLGGRMPEYYATNDELHNIAQYDPSVTWIKNNNVVRVVTEDGSQYADLECMTLKTLYREVADCNDAIENGVLYYAPNVANVPEPNTWCFIKTHKLSDDIITQEAFAVNSEKSKMYIRRKVNGVWQAWDRVITSADAFSVSNVLIIVHMSSLTADGGKTYISTSFYNALADTSCIINAAQVIGSSGDFKDFLTVNNYGNYVYVYTTNANLAGRDIVLNVSFRY